MREERCQGCQQQCYMSERRCAKTVQKMAAAQDPAMVSFIPRSTPPSHDRKG